MLTLKRVEVQGFKSFCDKSEMRFAGAGVAAVVGPNGCGKSNLSDAISWVLGEQSAKSLRGSRMEDVIFAGTRDRKAVGMASVTMTLVDPAAHSEVPPQEHSNGNGHHPEVRPAPASGEITITRRLFRSGDSEYLINGRQARLRDIQDLFMGTGLGPESYAIIEQGRIGQILSTKPQDRRSVIEEAAGITRFKTKRRLAESRLEGAKQNLSRVFDILEEVSRQANSLKRQAVKAKRYAELKTEMTAQLRRSLSGRFRIVERDAAKSAIDLNLAAAALLQMQGQVAKLDKQQAAMQEQCYGVEAALTEARKQLSEQKLDAERTKGKLEFQSREVSSIEQRLLRGGAENSELEKRFVEQQLELSAASKRIEQLEQQTESARSELAVKSEERERVQASLRARESSIEAARQQVLRLLGEASNLKNQLAQIDQFLVGVDRDTERSRREETGAVSELERIEKAKGELSARMSARQLDLRSTVERRKTVEAELAARRGQAGESRKKLEELRNDVSRLKARRDSLENVISHRAYTTESVKRLFTAIERGQARDLRPVGVLADFVEVDAAHEKVAEEFLHEELEYVIVKDLAQAELGIDLMRSGVDGRATFLVEPSEQGNEQTAAATLEGPGVIAPLAQVLRFSNGLTNSPASLLPRLARCYLTEDRASAQRLASQHPDLYFLAPDGACYQGYAVSGGKKTGSGPLALKRELRELTTQFNSKQKLLDETRSSLEALEAEIATYSEDLEHLRSQLQTQEKDALALEHENRKLTDEFGRANSRLSVSRLELQRLSQERDRSATRRAENQKVLAEKEQARTEHENGVNEARAALTTLQQDVSRLIEEHASLRARLAEFEERRRSEKSAQQRLENSVREVAHRRQTLTAEMEKLTADQARLTSNNAELETRAASLQEQTQVSTGFVAKLAEEETRGRAELSTLEESLRGLRIEAQTASDRRSQLEIELVKRQAELKYLDETCRKELQIGVAELTENEDAILDGDGLEEAERTYQDLRARIEALGPVNPQAAEEFEEAQQRYEFLNVQRQDLLDSIRDTESAIQEIDGESRKRFAEAFEAINGHFREMFKTLFSGGLGEMRLSDEDNAGDSGIDIVASPPGKRLQSVLLLSGGERALTAMALLMAIFRYQPSPFCVLDEVDAPLDEANIERLTRLIKEMSEQTQFIVITHAKRTMESAQTLYGVTMQEPGVSKLVSVKFQAAQRPAVPEEAELAAV